ncbi:MULTISPECIES: hypothetical protein [Methanohalophilus]|jgi:hypothetical protein|uniref:Uncharacterized protein n=1 Tax=Methanohalophilus euhalobius TaxID=51203 RepID=A0A314ZWK0_9EURY|nr:MULTISPECIES: hypothetical protein [Methanohalophilus]PQV42873.1 hypothetical protein B0H22_104130 [Methanohalophilus euhalobius]RNI10458.1 hypothetical protein EDD83_03600 [Methanohalophilus euhalobius]RXG33873.1 hypothetical protein CI957_1425 [Methanohalophilus sp. WG1-DM]
MKEVRIVLIDNAADSYHWLQEKASDSKVEMAIVKAIRNKTDILKRDVHYGQPISKKLIPDTYLKNYGITNLFRLELPHFWRLLYTLKKDPDSSNSILVMIVDIVDHAAYDKLFGYQKK